MDQNTVMDQNPNQISKQEYADLLKRAHDLGIIAIGNTIINPDILRDAIGTPKRLSRCTVQTDPSLLRDVVTAIEQNPIDFKAIAKEMDRGR